MIINDPNQELELYWSNLMLKFMMDGDNQAIGEYLCFR
jgi:hypothetical protein